MAEKTKRYQFGVGRRKTSIARVRIMEGDKGFVVNKKEFISDELNKPFEAVGKLSSFGITVKVSGGGKQGQLEAIRHGISRALVEYDQEFRAPLKKAGLLKRDPREKERKKPGHKKARKSPQWSKR